MGWEGCCDVEMGWMWECDIEMEWEGERETTCNLCHGSFPCKMRLQATCTLTAALYML